MNYRGLPVFVDAAVPLERVKEDGTRERVLCWMEIFEGRQRIIIHPDRLAELKLDKEPA